jgi:hypothetical protein
MIIYGISFTFVSILMISAWTLKWASGYHRFSDMKWVHGDFSKGMELAEAFAFTALVLAIGTCVVVGITTHG